MGRGYSDIFFVYIGMIILVVKLFNFNIFGVFRRMNIFFFFFGGGGGGGGCGFMWIYFRGHHFIGLFYGAISIVNCLFMLAIAFYGLFKVNVQNGKIYLGYAKM